MIDILKFRLPIIQAPMAGGITIPALVAAVANTGAIGSFGFAYSNAQKINEDLIPAKSVTKNPINASELSEELLNHGLAIAPGMGFGDYNEFFRISACLDTKMLIEGMDILKTRL